jgi:hypothetical protein
VNVFKESNNQTETNVRDLAFKVGLLGRSKSATGRSCYRPIRSSFSTVFLGHIANAAFEPKFDVALVASRAAIYTMMSKCRPVAVRSLLT